jgi:hypothetical protein
MAMESSVQQWHIQCMFGLSIKLYIAQSLPMGACTYCIPMQMSRHSLCKHIQDRLELKFGPTIDIHCYVHYEEK